MAGTSELGFIHGHLIQVKSETSDNSGWMNTTSPDEGWVVRE